MMQPGSERTCPGVICFILLAISSACALVLAMPVDMHISARVLSSMFCSILAIDLMLAGSSGILPANSPGADCQDPEGEGALGVCIPEASRVMLLSSSGDIWDIICDAALTISGVNFIPGGAPLSFPLPQSIIDVSIPNRKWVVFTLLSKVTEFCIKPHQYQMV